MSRYVQRGNRRTVRALAQLIESLEPRRLLASFTVSNTNDTGSGSLRDAITQANTSSTDSTISFDSTAFAQSQSIFLDSALAIGNTSHMITINGPANGVIVFAAENARTMSITSGAKAVTLSGMTIFAGDGVSTGAGILDQGTQLNLTNVTITFGETSSGGSGGALYISGGTVKVVGSTIENSTASFGGGIYNSAGTLTVINSTITGNKANGTGSTDLGGGIADGAGATTTLDNVTIAQNQAAVAGGGIGDISPTAKTFTIANTVIAKNTAPSHPDADASKGVTSQGNNFIGATDGATGWVGSDLTGTALSPKDPKLGSLALNGGTTDTMLPQSGSPLIDAGNNALIPSGVTTDQRGAPRPANSKVDIGAVEVQPAAAPTSLVVTNNSDSGNGSLRAVIDAANSGFNSVNITFDPTFFATAKTITLTGDEMELANASITYNITGPSAGVTISGNNNTEIFEIPNNVNASISKMTFDHGNGDFLPGGIDIGSNDTVTLDHVTVSNNTSSEGGGIRVGTGSNVTITNSTFTGNSVGSGDFGGGIESDGNLTLTNDTFTSNSAGGAGGAVALLTGTGTITGCTFSGNSGTTIDNDAAAVVLINCTIANNTSGAGISDGFGSGVSTTLYNCTIAFNGGAGLFTDIGNGNSFSLANTIVAKNSGVDVNGAATSLGHNFIGIGGGQTWLASDQVGTTSVPLDPELSPLADNGGPTKTLLPNQGSGAVDAGSNALIPSGVTTDQRGSGFNRIVHGNVDIGAVELQQVIINNLVVNSTADDPNPPAGTVTLRSAVNFANAASSPTFITFDPTVFATQQTITLSNGEFHATNTLEHLTITGPAAGVIIDANKASRIFEVDTSVTFVASKLTLSNGSITDTTGGGAVLVNAGAFVTLDQVEIDNNTAGYGGGIADDGHLTMTNSTLYNNKAVNAGGLGIVEDAMATLINCTIADNQATGDQYSTAGGIDVGDFGELTLLLSTVSQNSADDEGGGIFNANTPDLATVGGSIIAGNNALIAPDADGRFTTDGHNVIGFVDGGSGWDSNKGDQQGSDKGILDAKLGDLGFNGGLTRTYVPQSGSPAIDHGDNALIPTGITTDQIGNARIANNTVDVGSVETGSSAIDKTPPAVTLTAPSNNSETNNNKPTFSGAAGTAGGDLPTITIRIYSGTTTSGTPVQTLTATASSGTYSVAPTTALADGLYTAYAEQDDQSGNIGTSSSATFRVDTVAPVVTLTSPADGSSTTNASPNFAGAAETPGGDPYPITITIYKGSSVNGTVAETINTQADQGQYLQAATSPLTPGTYTAQTSETDAAGNTGLSSANTFTVNSAETPTVTLTSPADGTLTNNPTVTFSGSNSTNTGDSSTIVIKLYSGSNASGTPFQTLDATESGGAYSASAVLADGTFTAQASESNIDGNTGTSSANTFTIDTVAPTVTLSSPADGSSSTNTSPTFTGTGSSNFGDSETIIVKIYSGSTASGTPVQTLTTTLSSEVYSVGVTSALGTGTYTAEASEADSAGNIGTSTANTFTITAVSNPLVVTNTHDTGDGSLRAAITYADANSDPNNASTITFDIPGSGVHTIIPASPLPAITVPLTINGYSQPGASANTNDVSHGDNAVILIELSGASLDSATANGLTLQADDIQIHGLNIHGFGGAQIDIGGTTTSNDIIAGDFIGTNPAGTAVGSRTTAPSPSFDGIRIDAGTSDDFIGGSIAANRNVISGNINGINTGLVFGINIDGNFIGTNAAGMAAIPNDYGITGLFSETPIGPGPSETRNVISGNISAAIFSGGDVDNSGTGNTIYNNYIGVAVDGTTPLGNGEGIHLVGKAAGNFIGVEGAGNIIANNSGSGVSIQNPQSSGNAVLGNSIYNNGGLGIDQKADDQVQTNDTKDADNIQNSPVITSATVSNGQVEIKGTLNSYALDDFLIEFFSNSSADPSGHGEGQTLLGNVGIDTDSNGDGSFDATFTAPAAGAWITATASHYINTGNNLDTSEFSNAVQLPGQALPTLSIGDVSKDEGNSGTTNFTFTVTRSGDTSGVSKVDYTTEDGTATQPSDYTATSGTLTFAAGQTTQTITVKVIGDTTFESDETFSVLLSNPDNATISNGTGTGTIQNDDAAPVAPTVAINDVSKNEGNSGTTSFVFTVTRSGDSSIPFTVDYATADGTATVADNDYQSTSGTLTFNAGDTTKTITVLVNGDTKVEADETFTVNLSNFQEFTVIDVKPLGFVNPITKAVGTGTIKNDDAAQTTPTLSINNVSHDEGNSGTTNFTFTVTRSGDTSGTSTVKYTTANGTASSSSDYTAISGTLTFKAGETTKTITVKVKGDTTVESDETFQVKLSSPTNATISNATGIGTIKNDDVKKLPTLSINNVSKAEGDSGKTPFTFTITRSGDLSGKSTVNYTTVNGSAHYGTGGYFPSNGTITFNSGEKTKTITIYIDAGTAIEPDQTFKVELSNPTGATISDGTGIGTILNDDTAVTIGDVQHKEGNSGKQAVQVTISLVQHTTKTVTVKYTTADGTAKSGSDYIATSGTLTFKPGETSKTITLFIIGDKNKENDETFFVNLTSATNADISDKQAKVTIVNDD